MSKIKFDFSKVEAHIEEIICAYKCGEAEPLDGDEVDILASIVKNYMNRHEGNLTDGEYEYKQKQEFTRARFLTVVRKDGI
ncbi:MAG: hypothetical protein Q8O10_10310 [candidate division Zixibacteria bacterium]|nr:hypothetical protein [candidate division Zixibacteria bacterium]